MEASGNDDEEMTVLYDSSSISFQIFSAFARFALASSLFFAVRSSRCPDGEASEIMASSVRRGRPLCFSLSLALSPFLSHELVACRALPTHLLPQAHVQLVLCLVALSKELFPAIVVARFKCADELLASWRNDRAEQVAVNMVCTS